jgi:hypothetical protein
MSLLSYQQNLIISIKKITMAWIFKITALSDQWAGAIKKGETFTLVQNSTTPNHSDLVQMIKARGTFKGTSSSLPSLGLNDNVKNSNGWLIERQKG